MALQRVPRAIPGFRKSYALVSLDHSADTAVVFVHGFAGAPTSTWLDFQSLARICAPTHPWWDKADLFFYSYESLRTPIGVNAYKFGEFVGHVLSRDANGKPHFPTSDGNPHKKLIVAAHSEGAVVVRKWILDRLRKIEKENDVKEELMRKAVQSDIALNAELRLFAPACMGTNFSSLLGFVTSLSTMVSAIAASSLVRNELLPTSPVLTLLREGTEEASTKLKGLSGLSAKVLFGDQDQVVYTAAYQYDEIEYVDHHDHFSVCKPGFRYLRPLEFVK